MPALKLNVLIEQGATFQREFTITDPVTGAAFDLTGFTIRAPLKNMSGDTVVSFASNINTNKLLIELADEQTAALAPSAQCNHTSVIEAESPAGKVYRIAQISAVVSAR